MKDIIGKTIKSCLFQGNPDINEITYIEIIFNDGSKIEFTADSTFYGEDEEATPFIDID